MKPLFTLILLSICSQFCSAQNPHPYIEAFQNLAIQEMDRTGIPASITLAQGIIESAWGKGVLARESNNHFGIKCKNEWAGRAFHLEDDDYDSEGNLVKSCFRAYDDAATSYLDHSDFLRKGNRYASLFDLDPTDYVSWAHGLKSAGYATDPEYANKLINKIEEYQLYRFDYGQEIVVMNEGKTGVTEQPSSKITTNVAEEIMEAPVFIIPTELSDDNIVESTANISLNSSTVPTTKVITEPEIIATDLNVQSKVEKVNIKKRRMTLHGAFGEL